MNKEEAIEYIKNYKYDNEVRQAIDTVLDYIADLEKENKHYKKYAVIMSTEGLLINGVKFSFNDYISKQNIRDKIEEIEEKSKKYQGMQGLRYSEIALDAARIQVLKELLESEN